MPALPHYEIVTEPTSLQASSGGTPCVATVYVIASNTRRTEVEWESINVDIRVGAGADGLTDDLVPIRASVEPTFVMSLGPVPQFGREAGAGVFRAQSSRPEGCLRGPLRGRDPVATASSSEASREGTAR